MDKKNKERISRYARTGAKYIKKVINITALQGILLLHAGTQAHYCANRVDNAFSPSEERAAFEQEFDIPILGYKEDVETSNGSAGNISVIVEALHKERLEKPVGIISFEFVPESYFKKDIIHQIVNLTVDEGSGYQTKGFIGLNDSSYLGVIHHEIKHAKTDEILELYPEFRDRWIGLAADDNGKSLYTYESRLKRVLFRIKGLESSAIPKEFPSEENTKLGFVSSYARRDYYEDIAELCGMAETSPSSFYGWLYQNESPGIKGKVELAQEYGLIPREFPEFVRLHHQYLEASQDYEYHSFLKESEEFLKTSPESVYTINLRNLRGKTFQLYLDFIDNRLEKAIQEFKFGLNAPFKDSNEYLAALNSISRLYSKIGLEEKAELYKKAELKYKEGYKNNNVKIVINGVNDFLRKNFDYLPYPPLN